MEKKVPVNINKLENTKERVDAMLESFNDIVFTACHKSLRKSVKPKNVRNRTQKKKWFDLDLSSMRKQMLYKSKQYSKYPCDPAVRGSFFKYRKLYSRQGKKKSKQFKENLIEKLNSLFENDPNAYWNLLKDLKDTTTTDPSKHVSPDKWTSYFKNLFSIKPQFNDTNSHFQNLLSQDENWKTFNELDFCINANEVNSAIKGLKNKKSVGLDGIKNEMLKYSQTYTVPCIVKLFNMVLSSGCYPEQWKRSYIKPLYKGGDQTDPSNYRGITVMPCLAKLFNSVLNNRLQKYLDKEKIIMPNQIGFQPKARTVDHMFILRTVIEKSLANNNKLYVCFVDFAKAFDTVLHSALLYKLRKNLNIAGPFYNIIKNMYLNNKVYVRVENKLAEAVTPHIGVRQGDNLSPNMFKIFINDLVHVFNRDDDPVKLHNQYLSCLLYADDLILMSSSMQGLQGCLNKLHKYCSLNGLTVDMQKTRIVIFSKVAKYLRINSFSRGRAIKLISVYWHFIFIIRYILPLSN